MADRHQPGHDMLAFIIARGMEEATAAVTDDGGALTDDERLWLEIGTAFGVLACLESLTEAGWLPCSD